MSDEPKLFADFRHKLETELRQPSRGVLVKDIVLMFQPESQTLPFVLPRPWHREARTPAGGNVWWKSPAWVWRLQHYTIRGKANVLVGQPFAHHRVYEHDDDDRFYGGWMAMEVEKFMLHMSQEDRTIRSPTSVLFTVSAPVLCPISFHT